MRRVWFKKAMKEAILARKKTSTTRYKALPLGEVRAVSGSRYNAVPFAVLEIRDRFPATWYGVMSLFYREEGFSSPTAMEKFLQKEGLVKGEGYLDDHVYFHKFKVKEPNQ